MKKFITAILFGLLLSSTGTVCAQEKDKQDPIFSPPPNSIREEYSIDLGKGNKLYVGLEDRTDLPRLENIDSILMVFLADMKAFRDSLADPMTTKWIDYNIDTSGRKKVRLRQYRSASSTFLLDGKEGSEPALLRLQQDTIYIMLVCQAPGKRRPEIHYCRLGFFINQYSDLEKYVTDGLNAKMRMLSVHDNYTWRSSNGRSYLRTEPTISEAINDKSYLRLDAYMNVQNYKNYFAPSVGLGPTAHLQHGNNIHEIGVYWEPVFLFSPNAQGRLQTYRNDFLVASYDFFRDDKQENTLINSGLLTNISLGYLITHKGDYFEKPSFRITAGSLKMLNDKLRLEPAIWFHDFFKGVTPGLRLSFQAL